MKKPSAYRVYLTIVAASSLFSSMMFTVLAVYYAQTVGLNPLQLVLVGTVLETTIFLFEVPTGVVADTYSRRLSVIIGQFLIGVCFVIEGLVPLFGAILLAEVIRGVGETFISGALEAWIADEVGEEAFGRVYLRGGQVRNVGSLGGMFLGVGLSSLQLNMPVVLGGALTIGLAVFLILVMPERGFKSAPRGERQSWQAMGATLRDGLWLVRRQPVVLTLLIVSFIIGAHSEGIDRLWEAHLLTNFRFPALGSLKPVVWFGLINAGSLGAGLLAGEVALRRLNLNNSTAMARSLLVISGLYLASISAFGIVGSFGLTVGALWARSFLGTMAGALETTWLNRNLNSQVRATVLSMRGQTNALGQFLGGPPVGAIGTTVSLRAAMIVVAVVYSPMLLLYGCTLRRERTKQVLAEA
jgi:DHA3 family tetracycline resistance protein-like MFS transporter